MYAKVLECCSAGDLRLLYTHMEEHVWMGNHGQRMDAVVYHAAVALCAFEYLHSRNVVYPGWIDIWQMKASRGKKKANPVSR